MNKAILTFLLLTFGLIGSSQVVNIENRRIYDDTSGWSGAIDAGFSAVQNKDLLLTGSFRPRVQFKTKKHYYLFLTDWVYSKGAERIYANSGMIHFRYAYRLGWGRDTVYKSPWKWESYAQIQYNQLLDQRMRALAGSGLRVKFLDKKGYKFFAGTSAFYEYEDIQSSSEIIEDVRWSNYLSWFIDPKTNFSFSGATYFQPNFSDFNDFRLMGQYALMFRFFKRVDFRIDYTTFYDTRPPENVRNWIFSSSAGVRIRLGE
jgi:hypothetical protein